MSEEQVAELRAEVTALRYIVIRMCHRLNLDAEEVLAAGDLEDDRPSKDRAVAKIIREIAG